MTNLVRGNIRPGVGVSTFAWEPYRLLREMLSWDPLRAIETGPWGAAAIGAFSPEIDVKETADAYVISADLPGVNENDIEINLAGNQLSIFGKRELEHGEEGATFYAEERRYGSFTRVFTLPDGVDADNVEARLEHGVLTVHLPKTPDVKAKKISIGGIFDKVKGLLSGEKASA